VVVLRGGGAELVLCKIVVQGGGARWSCKVVVLQGGGAELVLCKIVVQGGGVR